MSTHIAPGVASISIVHNYHSPGCILPSCGSIIDTLCKRVVNVPSTTTLYPERLSVIRVEGDILLEPQRQVRLSRVDSSVPWP